MRRPPFDRVKGLRFAAKIGKTPNRTEAWIGWALVRTRRSAEELAAGEHEGGDPVANLIAEYRRQELERGAGDGIELYIYKTDAGYVGSRAHEDGLSRAAHAEMIRSAAVRIAREGIKVTVLEVE